MISASILAISSCWRYAKIFLMTCAIELTPYQSPGSLSIDLRPSSVIWKIPKGLSGWSRNKAKFSRWLSGKNPGSSLASLAMVFASIIWEHLIMQPQPQSDVINFLSTFKLLSGTLTWIMFWYLFSTPTRPSKAEVTRPGARLLVIPLTLEGFIYVAGCPVILTKGSKPLR